MRRILVALIAIPMLAGAGCSEDDRRDQRNTGHDGSESVGTVDAGGNGDNGSGDSGYIGDDETSSTPGDDQSDPSQQTDGACIDDDGDLVCACTDGENSPACDCNDSDPAVKPGAVENCTNGIDDNCDGLTDNQAPQCTGSDGGGFTAGGGDATCGEGYSCLLSCNKDMTCIDACGADVASGDEADAFVEVVTCFNSQCSDVGAVEAGACMREKCWDQLQGCGLFSNSSGQGGTGPGGTTGALSCQEILGCLNNCPPEETVCLQNCLAQGTPQAQQQILTLFGCFNENSQCGEDPNCYENACSQEIAICLGDNDGAGNQNSGSSGPGGTVSTDGTGGICADFDACTSRCDAGDQQCFEGCFSAANSACQDCYSDAVYTCITDNCDQEQSNYRECVINNGCLTPECIETNCGDLGQSISVCLQQNATDDTGAVCSTQLGECFDGELSCEGLNTCLGNCSDENCSAECWDRTTTEGQSGFDALGQCYQTNCVEYTEAQDIDECLTRHCESELNACFGPPPPQTLSCSQMWYCIASCNAKECRQDCFAAGLDDAQEAFLSVADCVFPENGSSPCDTASFQSWGDVVQCAQDNCPAEWSRCN